MSWTASIVDRSARFLAPAMALLTQQPGLKRPISVKTFLSLVPRGKALEVGPFHCPKIIGENVAYFDVLDQKQLRARAVELGFDPSGCPAIDHVSSTGDLAVINDTFDAVFSSHCIEHQPDLISHLQKVERVLEPGACYYVIVPDKRYCFDHDFDVSEVGDVYQAYLERRTNHTAQAIVRHRCNMSHNEAILHWLGRHGPDKQGPTPLETVIAECDLSHAGNYVDVHAWYFTPKSFASLIDVLGSLKLIGLSAEAVYDTRFGAQEFYAVLKKA